MVCYCNKCGSQHASRFSTQFSSHSPLIDQKKSYLWLPSPNFSSFVKGNKIFINSMARANLNKVENFMWQMIKGLVFMASHLTYRISANSFRGNYSFLNLALCTVTFDLYFINLNSCRGNYSREETIQGRKLFTEIR